MPIQFEEVTAQIDRAQPPGGASPIAPSSAPDDDFETQLEHSLRLREERAARLSAD